MTIQRTESSRSLKGPVICRVVGHNDSKMMGGLKVVEIGPNGDVFGDEKTALDVYYCPPFFGSTNKGFNGQNTGNDSAYGDTQKSYGMSFVPPDIGVKVLCIFIESTRQGFWIGCIPDDYMNHMVPGIAGATNVDWSPSQSSEYGIRSGEIVPVAEFNTELPSTSQRNNDYDANPRPVHPLAGFLLDSGLIKDYTRGPSTSTMRRAPISNVYGISTPGPIDKRSGAPKRRAGTAQNPTEARFVSRVGGHQFVMDDGDPRFERKTTADAGPPEYADTTKGESGDSRIPYGEAFRIRTRTGHQILLHNSEDLIYIGNSRGTAWIELTSDGKIDIFAQDSISIHSQQDFNFRADRDINLEAKRNINMKSVEGNIHAEAKLDFNVLVEGNLKIKITGNNNVTVEGDSFENVTGSVNVSAQDIKTQASNGFNVTAQSSYITSSGSSHFLSSRHIVQAGKIELNCDPASPATTPTTGDDAPEALSLHLNTLTDITQPFASTEYQSTEGLESIMKRIPMHEPWYQHENLDPLAAAPTKTDRDAEEGAA